MWKPVLLPVVFTLSALVAPSHAPPSAPPKGFLGRTTGNQSITLFWQAPDEESLNGILLGYIIRFKPFGYSWDLSSQTRNVSLSQINPGNPSFELTGLEYFSRYDIQIAAYNIKGTGVYSGSITYETWEGHPTSAPRQLQATTQNSTAVVLTWLPPDRQNINGRNLGYKILYNKNGDMSSILSLTVPHDALNPIGNQSTTLAGLSKYTDYTIRALCFTGGGDGVISGPVTVRTDEDECSQILNCTTCQFQSGVNTCQTCHDGFAINAGQTACCSVGCYQDANGYAACYANQTCVYSGCQSGFFGPKCTSCQSSIQFCDNCHPVAGSSKIECLTCTRGYYRTTDAAQCCSNEGCNLCTGTNNAVCSGCKPGWFHYQNSCDQCGTTCVSPPNGTARCDPVTGSCYYGCQPNYHGSKCQRLCNLANCNTCTYNELSDNLTCAVCVAGRYGPYCTSCNSNCLRDTGEICIHNGTCLDGCRPGYRGDKCNVACDKTIGMANCDQCDRYQFACTVCKSGFWGPQCQFTCGVNCVAVGGVGGARYCDITDGTCRDGCIPTYYKNDCSGFCPNCENNVCHRTAGTCLDPICDSGFYSATCDQTCPANCGLGRNGLAYCNFTNGDCTYGCRDGYYGEKCTIGCSRFCARSPANTELGPLCNQAIGNCVYACEAGFYTPTCSAVCRSTCVDKTCDINSGTCAECDKGVNAGVLCPTGTVSISPDSSNPDSNNDRSPLLAAAVGGSVGGFSAGVVLVIVIIVLRRRNRAMCPCQLREESGLQSDNSDTYAHINANARSQEEHMYAGSHANRNYGYETVEPGHLETSMTPVHQGVYVPLDSRQRNQQIYNSLITPQPQPSSESRL